MILLTILTPNSDGGIPDTDEGQPDEPGRGEGDQHHQGDLHLVLDPVDGEAHDGGEGALAQHREQPDQTNVLVLETERPEVVHHHTQPGAKNTLDVLNVLFIELGTLKLKYPEAVRETDEERRLVPEELPGSRPELDPLDGGGGGRWRGRGGGEVGEEEEEERHRHPGLEDHVVVNVPLYVRHLGAARGQVCRVRAVFWNIDETWAYQHGETIAQHVESLVYRGCSGPLVGWEPLAGD